MHSVRPHERRVAQVSAAESESIVVHMAVQMPTTTLLRILVPYLDSTLLYASSVKPPSAARKLRSAMQSMGHSINSSTPPSSMHSTTVSPARSLTRKRALLHALLFVLLEAAVIYSWAALSPIMGSKRARISSRCLPNRDRSSSIRMEAS